MKPILDTTKPYVLKIPNSNVLTDAPVKYQEIRFLEKYFLQYADGNKILWIDMNCSDNMLWADVYEIEKIQRRKPSRRANSSRFMQRERTATAHVYSSDVVDWDGFVDMVHELAIKLHENFWNRYHSPLDGPLEGIMVSECLSTPINMQ